jgi:hypothetical protein
MVNQDPTKVDYANLQQVKAFAIRLSEGGEHMTVILRPFATSYNIIPTSRERDLMREAMVVFRTGEHL